MRSAYLADRGHTVSAISALVSRASITDWANVGDPAWHLSDEDGGGYGHFPSDTATQMMRIRT
ncbi:hypothetical protein AQJ27_43050 [Streptomyces olivochromogenes]|nr:hypothetical protein AQJ27_43050 [Streptomyces olivochromogenes]